MEDKLKWVGQEKPEKGELYKCQLNIIEELILVHRRS